MKLPIRFREYIWLINTIRRARRISLAEINQRWLETEMSEGVEISRSSFHRHKEAIREMFGISIECDRQNGFLYYIGNELVLLEDSVQNWLLSTLSVNNVISESLALQDRILLQPVPSEGRFLKMVINAMKKSVKIAIDYRKYGTDEPNHLTFEPYCIKLFKQRWYVLGRFRHEAKADCEKADYFRLFSFDRIMDMKLTKAKFKIAAHFNAKDFFSECYGVLVGDGSSVERIVVRAYGYERFYLRDLPIHKSQHEIGQGDDFADFELYMRPTIDLRGHILSRGNMLKVLSPKWLADEIRGMHVEAAAMYEKEQQEE